MGNNPCIQRHNIHGSHPYPTGRSTLQIRGKLALLVPLLALAILLLVPALVFAEAPAVPGGLTATSGDGTMVLEWKTAARATGYQFRYSNQATGLLESVDELLPCNDPCMRTDWAATDGGTDHDIADHDIAAGTLTVGTTYYFQVRAVNDEGTSDDDTDDTYSDPSAIVSAIQRVAPPAVQDLAATAGNAQVTLTWTHLAAYDITSYIIRREGGASGSVLTTTTEYELNDDKTEATYTVSPLVNGTEYSFQVKGYNSIGEGPDFDVEEFVTATPSGPPAAPRDLTAQLSSSDGTQVKLTWANPNDDNIDEYQYRVRANIITGDAGWEPDWTFVPKDGSTLVTTYTVEGLISAAPGYEFQVRAIDTDRDEGDQAGPHSSVTGTPTTSETAPQAMTNVQHAVTGVSGGSGGMVTFTWADPGDDSIDKYQYRYDATESNPGEGNWDQDWINIPGDTANNKDMTIWGPDNIPGSDTVTFYELRAVNNDADDSATADINEGGGPATAITLERSNTPDSPTTPGAPAGLTASAAWNDQGDTETSNDEWDVTLTWTAPGTTIIGKYQYQQSVGGGTTYGDWTDFTSSGTTVGTMVSQTLTGVTAGTVYVYKLRGVDTGADPDVDGVPATSNPVTPGTPNAPTLLKPTDGIGSISGNETSIGFDWTEGADEPGVTVTGYEYRYRPETVVSWSNWADTTYDTLREGVLPPLSHADLEGGTKYDFQVRAMAGTIPSGPSNTSRGITLGALNVEFPSALNRSPEAVGSIGEHLLAESDDPLRIDMKDKFIDPNGDTLKYIPRSSDPKVAAAVMEDTVLVVTPVSSGDTTITVIAQDELGLFDDQSFKVTVERASTPVTPGPTGTPGRPDSNAAPVAKGAIGAQSMTEGGAAVTINVAGNFSDSNGDELTYTARSSDESVATVSVNGSMVTVTTAGAGTATITVTARDPGGAVRNPALYGYRPGGQPGPRA